MTKFYKAVNTDYRDFATGTIDYSVGREVVHPKPGKFGEGDASGYLSVATEPTGCIGASWPLRLLEVEVQESWQPHKKHGQEDYRNKHAVHSLTVVREIEAWRAFGPQGERIAELTDKAEELWKAKCTDKVLWDTFTDLREFQLDTIYRPLSMSGFGMVDLRGSSWCMVPYNDLTDALRVLVVADLLDKDNTFHSTLLMAAETAIVKFEKIYSEYKNPRVRTLRERIVAWFKKF